jgi:hypothetical protein
LHDQAGINDNEPDNEHLNIGYTPDYTPTHTNSASFNSKSQDVMNWGLAYSSIVSNGNYSHAPIDHGIHIAGLAHHQPIYQIQGYNTHGQFDGGMAQQLASASVMSEVSNSTTPNEFITPHIWESRDFSDHEFSREYNSNGVNAPNSTEASNVDQPSSYLRQQGESLINTSLVDLHKCTPTAGGQTGIGISTHQDRTSIKYASYPDLSNAATTCAFLGSILQNEHLAENNLPPYMGLQYAPCQLPDYKWLEKDGQKAKSEWYTRAEEDERRRTNETLTQFTNRVRTNREKGILS